MLNSTICCTFIEPPAGVNLYFSFTLTDIADSVLSLIFFTLQVAVFTLQTVHCQLEFERK